MKTTIFVPIGLAAVLGLGGWATLSVGQQTFKCWTNSDGVRECGNSLPPSAAQGGYETRGARDGRPRTSVGAARPKADIDAEREMAEKQAELDRVASKLRREQQRRDQVLMHTFASEAELLSARDGQLDAMDSRIQHTNSVANGIIKKVRELEAEAARAERAGKDLEQTLLDSISDNLAQVQQQFVQIDELGEERTALEARFADDLARYRALQGS